MKKYLLNDVIGLLQKVSPRFDSSLRGENELYADFGMDSREFIHVIREIEQVLKHEIDDEDLLEAELITINDLINFINYLNDKFNPG